MTVLDYAQKSVSDTSEVRNGRRNVCNFISAVSGFSSLHVRIRSVGGSKSHPKQFTENVERLSCQHSVDVLDSADCVVFQAVWALGNIAGDNAECRDYVLNCGILPSLQQ